MRKFIGSLVFILLLILCLIFFLKFYETSSKAKHEKVKINSPEVTITHKVKYETIAKPPKKVIVRIRKPVYNRPVKVEKPAAEAPNSGGSAKPHYYYSVRNTKPHYYHSVKNHQTPEKETAPAAPPPPIAEAGGGNTTYRYETTVTYIPQKETKAKQVSEVSFPKESMLKYVLFTVNYDAHMFAGETTSLELTMSPKNALENLEKVMQEKKIGGETPNQIKALEKVQSQYKYVSAELVSKRNCLKVEKRMPAEEKIYMPSIKESSADVLWQWDLTAPEKPSTKICNLSLYIRFCLNQSDCLPMQSPDKEFNIEIEITLGQIVYQWFHDTGNIASIAISIITVIGCIVGYIKFWRRRTSKTKSDNDPRRSK